MTQKIFVLSIAAVLAFAAGNADAEGRLTVYSGDYDAVTQSDAQPGGAGFALFERRIGFDLKSGDNEVSLGGLPTALDASSVALRPIGDASVRGQRFDFAVAGQQELLRRAIGQTVAVEQAIGNERQSYSGTLLAAGDGLTLRLADGRIKMLSNYSSFELPRLPEGVVSEPTLHWAIASGTAGRQDFDFGYATAGLAWRAEYLIDASGQGKDCRMNLEGAAMVVNRSGAEFKDVMLTLVAGEPNRSQGDAAPAPMQMKATRAMVMANSAPTAQASGEYEAYKLPNPGTLPQGSVQRLPLVDPVKSVACERRYETSSNQGDWMPPTPIIDANFGVDSGQPQPVVASLRFKNSKALGLGIPLPAGRVRMFEGKDFLGETDLAHTAANEDVALAIGNVFDLKATRRREDFQLDRDGRTMTETISVGLINSKPTPATVRVSERLARWTDWAIVSSSVPFEKRNSQTVSFDVPVPAGGESKLSYTVRYRWAPTIHIP